MVQNPSPSGLSLDNTLFSTCRFYSTCTSPHFNDLVYGSYGTLDGDGDEEIESRIDTPLPGL